MIRLCACAGWSGSLVFASNKVTMILKPRLPGRCLAMCPIHAKRVLRNWGKGIYFRGKPNFEGNRGIKTIMGNRENKKTIFRFWGNRGTSQFISGGYGKRCPTPLEASSLGVKKEQCKLRSKLHSSRSFGFLTCTSKMKMTTF